jgi:hypothetical protein
MKRTQTGSVRVAIIVTLIIVVVGIVAGSFVWWNVLNKKDDNKNVTPPSTNKPKDQKKLVTSKTYVDVKQGTGLALTYPSTWQVSEQFTPDSAEAITGGYKDAKNLVTIKNSDGSQEVELDIYTSPGLGGACEGDKINSVEYESIKDFSTLNYIALTKTASDGKLAFLTGAFPKALLTDPAVDADGCQVTTTGFYFQPGKDSTKRATLTIRSNKLYEDKWNLKPSITKADVHQEMTATAFQEAKAIVLSLHIQ